MCRKDKVQVQTKLYDVTSGDPIEVPDMHCLGCVYTGRDGQWSKNSLLEIRDMCFDMDGVRKTQKANHGTVRSEYEKRWEPAPIRRKVSPVVQDSKQDSDSDEDYDAKQQGKLSKSIPGKSAKLQALAEEEAQLKIELLKIQIANAKKGK